MDKVVVTGGAGFIGSHLATHFVHAGFEVVVLDSLATGYRHNLAHVADGVRFVEGDVRDAELVRSVVDGARWVLHQAAMVSVPLSIEQADVCHAVNGTGVFNVLDAAARSGCEALTFAASAAAYGLDPAIPKLESMAPAPVSPYAATKLLGEHYCATWTAAFGLPCVPLRYFNIYGERQDPKGAYAAVISKFVERMMGGDHPIVFGDGLQTRDFCHVADVVAANRLALENAARAGGAPINIGTGRETSLLDLIDALNHVLGTAFEPELRDTRAGDVKFSRADISRARDVLGYAPSVALEDGLSRLVRSLESA